MIRPILEYGSVLFDNCSLYMKQRLENLQKRAATACTGAFVRTSYDSLMFELGWDTLDKRRKYLRLSLYNKIKIGLAPQYLLNLLLSTVSVRTTYNLEMQRT